MRVSSSSVVLLSLLSTVSAANNEKKKPLSKICTLDDPRLLNPWAVLPDEHRRREQEQQQTPVSSSSSRFRGSNNNNDNGRKDLDASQRRQLQDFEEEEVEALFSSEKQLESWDVIIVGAGPGGIAAAKTILDNNLGASVLMLERGPPLSEYIAKGYDDALMSGAATADPQFREDVEGTPIVVGTGVGGGTLHFGMQFIDQDGVADASARQGATANVKEEVAMFAEMTGATSYTDEDYFTISDIVGKTYLDLMDEINGTLSSEGIDLYRNKVYKTGTDINDQPRLLLGQLLENYANLEIRTGVTVTKVITKESIGPNTNFNAVRIERDGGDSDILYGSHIVLAAGALNSARLALNDGIATPTGTTEEDATPYIGPVWDHQGLVLTYFAPGTTFVSSDNATSGSDISPEYSTDLGLQVFADIEEVFPETDGFVALLSLPALTSQEDVDILKAGETWAGADPVGDGDAPMLSYVFDLGDFFTTSAGGHPGGDITSVVVENGYELGFVLDTLAPETHKSNKLGRVMRAGGRLIGIVGGSSTNSTTSIEFDYSTVDVAGESILGHLQTRPDHHRWQYYYTTAGESNMLITVSTTGELIEDDGRVYAGRALGPDTVDLPTLQQAGFEAIMEGIMKNHEVLTNLGYFTQVDVEAITDIETLVNTPGYLPTTYHYHGTLSATRLAPGFYAGDLSRMTFKWAGSTSVAAAAMGIQAGKEVLCQLSRNGCRLSSNTAVSFQRGGK